MVMMLIGNRLMSDFFEIDFLDVELKQMEGNLDEQTDVGV